MPRGGKRCGDPPVVDFLAVVSVMRLTELFNEARPGETSPRDTYLKVGGLMSSGGGHSSEAHCVPHTQRALKSVGESSAVYRGEMGGDEL